MKRPVFFLLCLSIPLLAAASVIDQGNDGFVVGRSVSGFWENRPYYLFYFAEAKQARGPHKKLECLKDSMEAFFCDEQADPGCWALEELQWGWIKAIRAEEAAKQDAAMVDQLDVPSVGESTKADKVNQKFRLSEQQDDQTDQREEASPTNHDAANTRRDPPHKPRSPFYMDATQVTKGLAGKGRGGISLSLVVDMVLLLDGEHVPLWNETLLQTLHLDGFLREKVVQLSANPSQPHHHPFNDPKMDILDILRPAQDCIDGLGKDIWDFDQDQPVLENTTLIGRAASGVWKQNDESSSLEYSILSFMEVFSMAGLTAEQESCFYNGIDSFFADPQESNGTMTISLLTPEQEQEARRIAFWEEEFWANNRTAASKDLFWSGSIGDANPSISGGADSMPVSFDLQHGVVVWVNGTRVLSLDDHEGLEEFVAPILDGLVMQPVEMLAPNHPFRQAEYQDQKDIFLPMGMIRLVKECKESDL